MTKQQKIRLLLKTANIEKSLYEKCKVSEHVEKILNEQGFCFYCNCHFLAHKNIMEQIKKIKNTRQIVVNKPMRRSCVVNAS